jgi:hypothetical protein
VGGRVNSLDVNTSGAAGRHEYGELVERTRVVKERVERGMILLQNNVCDAVQAAIESWVGERGVGVWMKVVVRKGGQGIALTKKKKKKKKKNFLGPSSFCSFFVPTF